MSEKHFTREGREIIETRQPATGHYQERIKGIHGDYWLCECGQQCKHLRKRSRLAQAVQRIAVRLGLA